jgi:hypothetical protein
LKWIIIAFIVFILLIFIILVSKIKVFLHLLHTGDDDYIKIEFRLWGVIRYKIEIPFLKLDEESPSLVTKTKVKTGKEEKTKKEDKTKVSSKDMLNTFEDTEKILRHVVSLHHLIRNFLKRVVVKKFEWHSIIGLGDAAATGMISGAVWAVKGSILAIISHYFKLVVIPQMTIQPHFQAFVSHTSFKCIFQFRIGHAMLAGIKLVKFWKGGLPNFKTKPLSQVTDKMKSI